MEHNVTLFSISLRHARGAEDYYDLNEGDHARNAFLGHRKSPQSIYPEP